MYYLYGSKLAVPRKLVATFDSERQLLAYVRRATLSEHEGVHKFQQHSRLAAYCGWAYSDEALTADDPAAVDHNPSPSML